MAWLLFFGQPPVRTVVGICVVGVVLGIVDL
jgi:hypothetical protein